MPLLAERSYATMRAELDGIGRMILGLSQSIKKTIT